MEHVLIAFAVTIHGALPVASYPVTDHGIALCEARAIDISGHCLPPCQTEDSAWCYWSASRGGNGIGRSFIDIEDGLQIFYVKGH